MATPDPTDRDQARALSIPPRHKRFLLDTFEVARSGINEDLANHPNEVRDKAKLRRESAAFLTLIEAVEQRSVKPDLFLCEVVEALAAAIDRDNAYARTVFEHGALHRLLDQLHHPPEEPIPPRRVLAANIARLRKGAGLSQEDLGFLAWIHPTWISHLESGRVNTNLGTMEKLAKALDVPAVVLLTEEGE